MASLRQSNLKNASPLFTNNCYGASFTHSSLMGGTNGNNGGGLSRSHSSSSSSFLSNQSSNQIANSPSNSSLVLSSIINNNNNNSGSSSNSSNTPTHTVTFKDDLIAGGNASGNTTPVSLSTIVNNGNHIFNNGNLSSSFSSKSPTSSSPLSDNLQLHLPISSPTTTATVADPQMLADSPTHGPSFQRNNSSGKDPSSVFDSFLNYMEKKFSIDTRNRSNSLAATLNANVNIENPQVWNDHPLITSEDNFSKENKRLFHRYTLRLPHKLEEEYLNHHFSSQIILLRLANLIGILVVSYGFTKKAIFMLTAIRILCFNLFAFSIFLSFLRNRNFYKRAYHPLFLFSYTTFFITILLEYKTTNTTLILFLYSVIFLCLYALGCLLFLWMVVCNTMHTVCFIIFLFLQSGLDNTNMISFILYIVTIFIMGSSHLYVLEKSRKETFVDSKRLQKKAECLRVEKETSEQLLNSILPDFVIKMMNKEWISSKSHHAISKKFPDCSILYCDIVGFTSLASNISPEQLVKLLNEVFTEFDRVVEEHGCEKIKTDGDAYVCAGGLTIEHSQHYKAIVDIAISILQLPILKSNCLDQVIQLRVGCASGSVIGGVIGREKFQFDVWGEAIALAHTLEQTGCPGKIHILDRGIEKLTIPKEKEKLYSIVENTDCPLNTTSHFIIIHPQSPSGAEDTTSSNQIIPTIKVVNIDDSNTVKEITNLSPATGTTTTTTSTQIENIMSGGRGPSLDLIIPISETILSSISSSSGHSDGVIEVSESQVDTQQQHGQRKTRRTPKDIGQIVMKPLRKKFVWGKVLQELDKLPAEEEVTEVDKDFRQSTRMNKFLIQFKNKFVEKEFHKYVISNTLFETKFFLVIGMILHLVFFIDDMVMQTKHILMANAIYLVLGITFIVYIVLSFTKLFRYPIIYQIAFTAILLLFGISTNLELLRYDNPLARSSLTRVATTLFYVNVFYSLNFICATFLNVFIFSFFFICIAFISPNFKDHLFSTDYIGIVIFLIVQVCSSYGMKLAMRKAWILKSKVKFKGLILQKEREKSAKLLENILPTNISEKLLLEGKEKGNGMLIAQHHQSAAIMFINIVGFEQLQDCNDAQALVDNMNHIFSIFDELVIKFDLEKIKTIGTNYMAAAGLKSLNGQPKQFLPNVADMALTAKTIVAHTSGGKLNVQIGINVGDCVSGCIGIKRAKYDVWGDTANIASRMQSSTPTGKIQVTKEVARILRHKFYIRERGLIPIKGKGSMDTYFIEAKKVEDMASSYDISLPPHWTEHNLSSSVATP